MTTAAKNDSSWKINCDSLNLIVQPNVVVHKESGVKKHQANGIKREKKKSAEVYVYNASKKKINGSIVNEQFKMQRWRSNTNEP